MNQTQFLPEHPAVVTKMLFAFGLYEELLFHNFGALTEWQKSIEKGRKIHEL